MDGNQTLTVEQRGARGGRREGSGRPSIVRRTLQQANGLKVDPLYAAQILAFVIDERRAWQRVFNSEDDRVILQALQFLVAMRDGKPAQRINVTSTSLQLNASDLERARAIVAEIRQDSRLSPSHSGELASADSGLVGESTPRLGAGDTAGMVQVASGRDGEDVADGTEKKNETQHNASAG